jgi:hypothetical protein
MPSCAVRLSPALLTLDPFLLLVAASITIAPLLLAISLRVHVTESGGLHARRSHTDEGLKERKKERKPGA